MELIYSSNGVDAAKQVISFMPAFFNSLIISSKVEPVVQISSIINILPVIILSLSILKASERFIARSFLDNLY